MSATILAFNDDPFDDGDPSRDHVAMLHKLAEGLDGKLILASYGQDPETAADMPPKVLDFSVGDVAGMAAAIGQLAADRHRNVYAPLAIMRPDLPARSKGGIADVVAVLGVVADFDDPRAADYLQRLPAPPDYVLETSAGRFQAFYAFSKPLPPGQASELAARLKQHAGCDHCTLDISHVWRVPGLLNWPNVKKITGGRSKEPQPVRIALPWAGTLTDPDRLAAMLPALAVKTAAVAAENQITAFGFVRRRDIPQELTERMARTAAAGEDRSETAFGVIRALRELGFSVADTVTEIEKFPDGVGQRYVGDRDKLVADVRRSFGKPADGLILDPKEPLRSAQQFTVARYATDEARRTLHCHNGQFHTWTGRAYAALEPQALKAELYEFLDGTKKWAKAPGAEKPTPAPFRPNQVAVNEMLEALKAVTYLPEAITAPAWLGTAGPPPSEIVSCANGLLHLPSLTLAPHTPAFFSPNTLDFDYRSDARPPAEWLHFLSDLWPGDNDAISALQEMFGYFLTPDTAQQKLFLMVGPKRSGKGTIGRVLTRLLGQPNVVNPTLASLVHNFGLASLIGKPLAIVADARLSGRTDQSILAERLLSISGEDGITIDRKYLSAWTGKLPTRFLILTNEMPKLADTSGALASRFVALMLRNSFFGKEDIGLTDRLCGELPGILNWSIEGWRRLRARRYFQQPKSSADALAELEALASPIKAFIEDRCETGAGREIESERLFAEWQQWCVTNCHRPVTIRAFGQMLAAAFPEIERKQRRHKDNSRHWHYSGISLSPSVTILSSPFRA